jgi:hypothetical protein
MTTTNEVDWTEAQVAAKPIAAADAQDRADVVQNFMDGKSTYDEHSKDTPTGPVAAVDPLDLGPQWPDIPPIASLAALKAHPLRGDAGTGSPGDPSGKDPAWTTGQYVTLGDGSKAHWDGAAWVAGAA